MGCVAQRHHAAAPINVADGDAVRALEARDVLAQRQVPHAGALVGVVRDGLPVLRREAGVAERVARDRDGVLLLADLRVQRDEPPLRGHVAQVWAQDTGQLQGADGDSGSGCAGVPAVRVRASWPRPSSRGDQGAKRLRETHGWRRRWARR